MEVDESISRVEIAKVISIDAPNMRGTVKSLKTGGTQTLCVMNQSPYFGILPQVGDIILVYTEPGWYSRYLMPITSIVPTTDLPLADRMTGDESLSGDLPLQAAGEVYIGYQSRLTLDSAGNALLRNRLGNLALNLNTTVRKTYLTGDNFSIYTPGDAIRILTSSSVPSTFGDSLRLEKNVPVPLIPEEINPVQTRTTVSYFELDSLGGVTASSSAGTASLRLSAGSLTEAFTAGNIRLENEIASLRMDATGKTYLGSEAGNLAISDAGALSMFGSGLTLSTTGKIATSSTALTLNSTTTIEATATTSINLQAPFIYMTGTPSMIGAPASVPLAGATAIALIPIAIAGVIVGSIPVIA